MKNVTEMKPKKEEVISLTPEKRAALLALDQRRGQQGFSLIELLVVVAIMLVIAAIAVPSLLKSKVAANQASAIGSLHTLANMSAEYNTSYGNGFPKSLNDMGTAIGSTTSSCTNAQLIDSALTAGQKSGYNFAIINGATIVSSSSSGNACSDPGYADGDAFTATPIGAAQGTNAYCVDMAQNVIYQYTPANSPISATGGVCPTTGAIPVGN